MVVVLLAAIYITYYVLRITYYVILYYVLLYFFAKFLGSTDSAEVEIVATFISCMGGIF
jgi:hypothetical protein